MNDQLLHLLPKDYVNNFPLSVWLGSIFLVLLLSMLGIFIYNRTVKTDAKNSRCYACLDFVYQVLKKPMAFLIMAYTIFAVLNVAELYLPVFVTLNKKIV